MPNPPTCSRKQSAPGSAFVYNSAAVHLLGVILEKATGMELEAYADRVLFGPLGIGQRAWEPVADGYVNGGSGLDLRPRDLARFGQLLLQDGWSGHRRIVPRGWVNEATGRRFSWTVSSGPVEHLSYGYLWWIDVDHAAYLAWGYGGQFIYVVPELDLVVVATTDWSGVSADVGAEALAAMSLGVIVDGILPTVH